MVPVGWHLRVNSANGDTGEPLLYQRRECYDPGCAEQCQTCRRLPHEDIQASGRVFAGFADRNRDGVGGDRQGGRDPSLLGSQRATGAAGGPGLRALPEAARQRDGRTQDRDHQAGQHRPQAGRGQAAGHRAHHPRQGGHPGGRGLLQQRLCHLGRDEKGEGAVSHHECRNLGDYHEVSLHRPGVVHHVAGGLSPWASTPTTR